ncbi:leucine-rich repeat domain-containing protein [Flammeovirga kamogawensis]|uniref:Leucine-rich repeat domain-containing protein n=1 Tax=Flammeovirga kamogawensis TaxID=373891 RepID=A0ABX8GYX7_9BACT|nr:leucine-rich repeat domain-containing protein [Flammeovirga kamogawensis]MBB6459253.1 Leucine-rich repeat (LRR) protein [Flammeovirga kamogawensis]QWG08815.1 leucine-rich repeat domain-containing protein [Flammeovirga kamogawensis]TRX67104.1 leucine-rich repeat domain-containing protein [Flammeovirga kamogawensis]
MKSILKILILTLAIGLSSFTLNNDPNTFMSKGLTNLSSENYLKAIGDFTMAISIQDNLGEAYYHRAICKDLLGKKEGYINSELCLDLIEAIKYDHFEAIEKLYELGRIECYMFKSAALTPDKAYCIDISSQNYSSIPNEFSEFSNLISISASSNKIKTLGTLYNSCPYIISLDLGQNDISIIPSEITKFKYLYNLNLSNNNLSRLPKEIVKLEHLSFLNLRGNQLEELPKNIDNLKSLKVLDLSLNRIQKLPKNLENLKNLETLVLAGNPLQDADVKTLRLLLPNTHIIYDM